MNADRPRRRHTTQLALLGLSVAALAAAPPAQAEVRRHAVIVGSNDGGEGMEPLLYAETDAGRVRDLLVELGGFAPNDVTTLSAPSPETVRQALDLHTGIALSTDEDLFFFYYSGHADAKGLRLGSEVMRYTELRRAVRDVPSDVRLGVLDACRSGEITRIKGLTLSAPFATAESLDAEGEAWLTAASADESAQESDQLQGSFFTHYLISGMRGAADKDDGVVSLEEAYAYARDRTVARTGLTDAGAQHPIYDYDLQGSRNLPLTDVRRATARIVLPETLQGEIVVLRQPESTPVAELAKVSGVEMTVALPPGSYDLRLTDDTGVRTARIGLNDGAELRIPDRFTTSPTVLATRKGGGDGAVGEWSAVQEPGTPPEAVPLSQNIIQSGRAAVDELALTAVELATGTRSMPRKGEMDWRHNAWIAGGASFVVPGLGQAYNGQYAKATAFGVPWFSFIGTDFGMGNESAWTGSFFAGPSPVSLAAWMTKGWAVADAWSFYHPDRDRPITGMTVGLGTGWLGNGDVAATGVNVDFVMDNGFSLGLDRSGWFQRPDGTGQAALGAKMMWSPWEGAKVRPALFAAGAVVGGTGPTTSFGQVSELQGLQTESGSSTTSDFSVHPVISLGTNLRWYTSSRYFLEFDARAEMAQGEIHGVYGGGLGVHFGGG